MASAGRFTSRAFATFHFPEVLAIHGQPAWNSRLQFVPQGAAVEQTGANMLVKFIAEAKGKLVCLSGAGCSTESGVPDYRSPEGSYSKGHRPMKHFEFINNPGQRARYWARSLGGWRFFDASRPNVAHYALVELERHGYIRGLVTQNVDGLHRTAGMMNVIDLHGRNNEVACLSCQERRPRSSFQKELEVVNAQWIKNHLSIPSVVDVRADGDAHLEANDFAEFVVPPCGACGGIWMPRVVFFGGSLDPA